MRYRSSFFPLLLFFVFGTAAWFSALGGGYRDVTTPRIPFRCSSSDSSGHPFGLLGQQPRMEKVLLYLNPAGCIDLFRYLLFDGFSCTPSVVECCGGLAPGRGRCAEVPGKNENGPKDSMTIEMR